MKEEEKLAKAKKQLLIIGVICIAVIVFVLWLVNLDRIFAQNQEKYRPALEPFRLERLFRN